MARVHSSLCNIRPLSPGAHVELALLRSLEDALPHGFELFHSVDWKQGQATRDNHVELDIVVGNSASDLTILEGKSGLLSIKAEVRGGRKFIGAI